MAFASAPEATVWNGAVCFSARCFASVKLSIGPSTLPGDTVAGRVASATKPAWQPTATTFVCARTGCGAGRDGKRSLRSGEQEQRADHELRGGAVGRSSCR